MEFPGFCIVPYGMYFCWFIKQSGFIILSNENDRFIIHKIRGIYWNHGLFEFKRGSAVSYTVIRIEFWCAASEIFTAVVVLVIYSFFSPICTGKKGKDTTPMPKYFALIFIIFTPNKRRFMTFENIMKKNIFTILNNYINTLLCIKLYCKNTKKQGKDLADKKNILQLSKRKDTANNC